MLLYYNWIGCLINDHYVKLLVTIITFKTVNRSLT